MKEDGGQNKKKWQKPKIERGAMPYITRVRNKANIVKLMHVTQHKPVATSNIILWADHYVMAMWQTADHVDARLKTVCRAV